MKNVWLQPRNRQQTKSPRNLPHGPERGLNPGARLQDPSRKSRHRSKGYTNRYTLRGARRPAFCATETNRRRINGAPSDRRGPLRNLKRESLAKEAQKRQ